VEDAVDDALRYVLAAARTDEDVAKLRGRPFPTVLPFVDRKGKDIGRGGLAPKPAVEVGDPPFVDDVDRQMPPPYP